MDLLSAYADISEEDEPVVQASNENKPQPQNNNASQTTITASTALGLPQPVQLQFNAQPIPNQQPNIAKPVPPRPPMYPPFPPHPAYPMMPPPPGIKIPQQVPPPYPIMPPPFPHPGMMMPGMQMPPFGFPGMPPVVPVDSEEYPWTEHFTPQGQPYYHNYKIKQSSWIKPQNYVSKQSVPILAERIAKLETENPWRKITTNLGQVFYWNKDTKESSWRIPQEVLEKLNALMTQPEEESQKRKLQQQEDEISKKQKVDDEEEEDEDSDDSEEESSSESEEEEAKNNIIVEGEMQLQKEPTSDEEPKKEVPKLEEEGELDENAAFSFEERVEIFRQMLREKNITPFSTWDKELPKFAFDSRFTILPNLNDRKAIFSSFVKTIVDTSAKERKDRLAAARYSIQSRIENSRNSQFNANTTLAEFILMFNTSDSFKGLPTKEKEKLYNDFIAPLKKQQKEKDAKEQKLALEDFVELLKEHDIQPGDNWLKIRRSLEKDTRFNNKLLTSVQKENAFKDHIKKLEDEKRKKQKEEAVLRDREREVQKEREKSERERRYILEKTRLEESVTTYKIMLREKIRDPHASWTESKKILAMDPRYNDLYLSADDKEDLFRDYTRGLAEEQVGAFRALLREVTQTGRLHLGIREFDEIKGYIAQDPRYDRISGSERQSAFEKYMRELKKEAFQDFHNLLRESKNTGLISSSSATSGEKFDSIKNLLKHDNRFKFLEPLPEERDKAIVDYIESLKR